MKKTFSIGWIIKRYIKLRNYDMKTVAERLGVKYKTFCERLSQDHISAEFLFQLANLLEIDLNWMSQLFNKQRTISPLEQYQMARMSSDFREVEYSFMVTHLDECIRNNPNSVVDAKNEFVIWYNKQLFYVLDVLLPESYLIQIEVDRNERERYYCISADSFNNHTSFMYPMRVRRATAQFYEGNDMLKRIIIDRKEKLGL